MGSGGKTITLTTDFGMRDGTVGAMKGVILGICPQARVVDIGHDIPARDVVAAALALEAAAPWFPEGSVHLAVVDPGVGGARKAIALQTPEAFFVGPDNGIFELVLQAGGEVRAFELREERYLLPRISNTFHGRDVFAPAAAHLANGVAIEKLGPPVSELEALGIGKNTSLKNGGVQGEVISFDRFGNAITSLTGEEVLGVGPAGGISVRLGRRKIGALRRTFSDVGAGEVVAYIGSSGRLEIGVRDMRLRDRVRVERGEKVTVPGGRSRS